LIYGERVAAPILVDSELSSAASVFLTGDLFAGDLAIIVFAGWNGTVGSNVPTLAIFDVLTWTLRSRAGVNSNKDVFVSIAYADVASDQIGFSTNVDPTNCSNYAALLYRLPGGAYVQHNSGTGDTHSGNPTTFTVNLSSPPSVANGVLLAFGIAEAFDGQNTIAPASGWTELDGNEDGTLADLSYMTAWREGSTSQACSVDFNNDEYVEVMVAVEFSAAGDTNITPSTVPVTVELPSVAVDATGSIAASTVAVVTEAPVAAVTADVAISPDTVEIVAEVPLATIPASDINPTTVGVTVEAPTPNVDVFTPTTDATISFVTIPLEFPVVTGITPDIGAPLEAVLVQVELPEVTIGGDATAGPPPLWRINGYPCPSVIGAVTRR
jgi:hypothetical protein